MPRLLLKARHGLVSQILTPPSGVCPGESCCHHLSIGRGAVWQHQGANITLKLILFIALSRQRFATDQFLQVSLCCFGIGLAGFPGAVTGLRGIDTVQTHTTGFPIDRKRDGIAISDSVHLSLQHVSPGGHGFGSG